MAIRFACRIAVVVLLLTLQRSAAVAQVPATVEADSGLEIEIGEQLPQVASDVDNDGIPPSQPASENTDNATIASDTGGEYSFSEQADCSCESNCGCGDPCGNATCSSHNIGGWIAAGYYSNETGLSFFGPLNDFNDYPDHLNLDQAWLYAEKVAQGGCCSADWGYRADAVYGVQAQKTQAFGGSNDS